MIFIIFFKLKVATKVLWMDQDIKSAINDYRIHHQLYPEDLSLEQGFPKVKFKIIQNMFQFCFTIILHHQKVNRKLFKK